MNMDTANKWLSFAANIGVIVGIVILAVEINQNSVINQVSSVQSIRQSMQRINLLSMENPSFAALHRKLSNNEDLDVIEQQQAIDFLLYMRGQSELAFYQFQNGLISEADLLQMLGPLGFWVSGNEFIRDIWEQGSVTGESELVHYVNVNLLGG